MNKILRYVHMEKEFNRRKRIKIPPTIISINRIIVYFGLFVVY